MSLSDAPNAVANQLSLFVGLKSVEGAIMKSEEKAVRCKLLKQVTFDEIRPHITEESDLGGPVLSEYDVSWITSQVIHRVRKILDYPGRRLGARARRKGAE